MEASSRRQPRPQRLTVAVTGLTGDIGRALMSALDRSEEVTKVRGMARREFDPAERGWTKVEYTRGDVLDRDSVEELVAGADVVVHLAFLIFGSHTETRHAVRVPSLMKTDRARSELGWKPEHDALQTLRAMVAGARAKGAVG